MIPGIDVTPLSSQSKPEQRVFTVQLTSNSGVFVQQHVIAADQKSALLAVLESVALIHPMWQSPGFQVQSYLSRKPIILAGS